VKQSKINQTKSPLAQAVFDVTLSKEPRPHNPWPPQ